MSLAIELDDGTVLEVEQRGDTITVGESEMRVEIIDAGLVCVHQNDRAIVAHVARDADTVWVAAGGRTWRFARPDRPRRQPGGGGVDSGPTVTPPMPGQVVQIDVAVGDIVEGGQTVAVVSAMKMETPLKAPYSGQVTAVHTEVGAQVNPGDVLVDIARRD